MIKDVKPNLTVHVGEELRQQLDAIYKHGNYHGVSELLRELLSKAATHQIQTENINLPVIQEVQTTI
jgi:Arc/MetJ-type ribon-helix-helix transcriptional regulator